MYLSFLFRLLGFLVVTVARGIPINTSFDAVGGYVPSIASSDLLVNTAETEWDPENIASDAVWNKHQQKGEHYQCLFEANDRGAGYLLQDTRIPPSAQSIWRGTMSGRHHKYPERRTWNWHENEFEDRSYDFEDEGLGEAFDALNLDTRSVEAGGHNVGWLLGHYDENRKDENNPDQFDWQMLDPVDQTYTVDGKTYRVGVDSTSWCKTVLTGIEQSTGGYYNFIVNQIDGAIIAMALSSPQNAIRSSWSSLRGSYTSEDLPRLRYGSDLIWGKWFEGNHNVRNLRVYAAHYVLNDATTAIVARAVRNKGTSELALWPGTAFEKTTDLVEFQALIGSPIGGMISILLLQHKEELGNKEIYQINVVGDAESLTGAQNPWMHLFFQIRDVPPPEHGEDDTPADS